MADVWNAFPCALIQLFLGHGLPFEGVQTIDIPFHLTEEGINFAAFLRLSTKKQHVARRQSGNKNRRDEHGPQVQFL